MKHIYLYASPSEIRLIKGDKMPVKPEFKGDYFLHYGPQKQYEAALQAAKESSIPIQDRERAFKILCADRIKIEPGSIWGPFTVEYKLKTTCKWHGNREACGNETCWDINECQESPPITVAILLPDKEPQEDQEDIFDEVFCKYFDIIYRERKSMHDAVRELMERFTITRKQ